MTSQRPKRNLHSAFTWELAAFVTFPSECAGFHIYLIVKVRSTNLYLEVWS